MNSRGRNNLPKERMMGIEELQRKLAEARAQHHAGEALPPGTIRKLADELNRQLTDGAKNCPSCQARPTAIIQPSGVELGCTNCRDHRTKAGATRDVAVAAWNAGEYRTPRS